MKSLLAGKKVIIGHKTKPGMSTGPSFEEYLESKKIDSDRFRQAEPELWGTWQREFGEMHPNSFTMQKLNLINPIRRKYKLVAAPPEKKETPQTTATPAPARPGKPVIRPKLG